MSPHSYPDGVQARAMSADGSFGQRIRMQMLHNHSTTNLNLIGLRPEGECSACDYARAGWRNVAEQGR